MGWASGSSIAIPLITAIKNNVPDEVARKAIYKVLYDTLCEQDWDTVDEAWGIDPLFDELDPYFEEEEDDED